MPQAMKCFSDDTKSKDKHPTTATINPVVRSQYVPISEENATIILDVEEEREKLKRGELETETKIDESADADPYDGLNIERE